MPSGLADAVIGAYQVKQVQSVDLSPNLVATTHRYSGGVVVQQVDITSGDPVVTIATQDIAGFVAGLSATVGLAVASGTVTIPVQDRTAGGLYVSNGSNYSMSFTDGLAVPVTISASQDNEQGAVATIEFHGASTDGLTNPITNNTTVTIASQAFNVVHDLGPVKLNSTTAAGVKSSTVNFGFTVSKQRYSGCPFCTIGGITINEVNPSFDFTFEDAASMHAFTTLLAISSTCIAYFRKRTAGGLRVANITAEHVACTLTGGLAAMQSSSVQSTGNYEFGIRVTGKTLAFSSTSAIS